MRRREARHQLVKHLRCRGILHTAAAEYVPAPAGTDEGTRVIQRQQYRARTKVAPFSGDTQELLDVGKIKGGDHCIYTLQISRNSTDRLGSTKITDHGQNKIS